jgi:hypothetical protein
MVCGITLRIACTWVISDTSIQAVSVHADLSDLTLLIRGTTNWNTTNIWVTCISFRAVTYRLVVVDIALSICSTVAGINTVSVITCLCLRALIIGLTSNDHRLRLGT